MDKYLYWLDNILYLGNHTKMQLIKAFQSGEEIYYAKESSLKRILDNKKVDLLQNSKLIWDVDENYQKLIEKEIKMAVITEQDYPSNLKDIPEPPFCLYYKGKMPDEYLPSVAIIGARECSEYGRYVAYELGKCLGEGHIQVISGMAAGIDGISQSAAMEGGGTSFGVLGCGVDICYPKSNRRLYEALIEKGGVMSSYPLGTQPLRQFFPPRNRIVSGLADVLIVVEARQRSGTSITVEMALEQGKDIYAVPGRVTDRLSDGCNRMLREGAHVFLSPQDFMEELMQLLPQKAAYAKRLVTSGSQNKDLQKAWNKSREDKNSENAEFEIIKGLLDFYPQHIDTIVQKLGEKHGIHISVSRLSTLLTRMCILGDVKQESPGWFSKSSL